MYLPAHEGSLLYSQLCPVYVCMFQGRERGNQLEQAKNKPCLLSMTQCTCEDGRHVQRLKACHADIMITSTHVYPHSHLNFLLSHISPEFVPKELRLLTSNQLPYQPPYHSTVEQYIPASQFEYCTVRITYLLSLEALQSWYWQSCSNCCSCYEIPCCCCCY